MKHIYDGNNWKNVAGHFRIPWPIDNRHDAQIAADKKTISAPQSKYVRNKAKMLKILKYMNFKIIVFIIFINVHTNLIVLNRKFSIC